ncbi:hypothetical protein, partial [Streptomyces sp. NPDC002215]|uniref:hypothetical protein n=1 Tax=Streptomyces sp. NPDC002215 TaxID=3154412 RepID=UPI003316AC95
PLRRIRHRLDLLAVLGPRRAARLRERATTEALAGPGDGALAPAKPFRPSAELLHKKRHPPFFWDPAFLFWPSHRIAQALGLL